MSAFPVAVISSDHGHAVNMRIDRCQGREEQICLTQYGVNGVHAHGRGYPLATHLGKGRRSNWERLDRGGPPHRVLIRFEATGSSDDRSTLTTRWPMASVSADEAALSSIGV